MTAEDLRVKCPERVRDLIVLLDANCQGVEVIRESRRMKLMGVA